MYSDALLDHLRNPRHAGQLPPPAPTVQVTNPVCGDVLRLSVRVESGVILEARFKAQGCPPTIACGSALAEWLHGRSVEALRSFAVSDLEAALGELPAASRHAAALAAEAVRELLRLVKREAPAAGPAHES